MHVVVNGILCGFFWGLEQGTNIHVKSDIRKAVAMTLAPRSWPSCPIFTTNIRGRRPSSSAKFSTDFWIAAKSSSLRKRHHKPRQAFSLRLCDVRIHFPLPLKSLLQRHVRGPLRLRLLIGFHLRRRRLSSARPPRILLGRVCCGCFPDAQSAPRERQRYQRPECQSRPLFPDGIY